MMVMKDEWLRAAMTDEAVVAELLLRLKQSHAFTSIKSSSSTSAATAATSTTVQLPPFQWGIRQRRTRIALRCDSDSPAKRGGADSMRNSPTTPLSWSNGGSSSSGTADGVDDSDFAALRSSPSGLRSKVVIVSKDSKKLRRKKTFAELKEEEDFLLKERLHLKKELASLHSTLTDRRATNQTLKKIKLEIDSQSTKYVPDEQDKVTSSAHTRSAGSSPVSTVQTDGPHIDPPPPPADSHRYGPAEKPDASFLLPDLIMLPDLNMTPPEEEYCPEILYAVS